MVKLHQRILGQGQPIVLIHGWGMHSGVWGEFATRLAKQYQVICIDLPGHGLSPPIAEFTLSNISKLLTETIESPCCWLGWSLGTAVVLDLAARYPERVRQLILLTGNPCFVQTAAYKQWQGMSRAVFEQFSTHLSQEPEKTWAHFLALQVHGLPDAKIHLKQLKQLLSGCPIPPLIVLQAGLSILKQPQLHNLQATKNLPVSVILAEQDSLVPMSLKQVLMNYPWLNVHIIERAGHAAFLSHPGEIVQLVETLVAIEPETRG